MALVQAGPVKLECLEQGQGDRTMVLVHGASSSARIWHSLQELLANAGVRTLAIGTRGAGASHRSPDPDDYNSQTYAADLAAALRALGERKFTLVGHSLGVMNSVHFMRDHASDFEVQALVLIAGGNLKAREAATPEQLRELEELMLLPGKDEATRRALWEPLHTGLPMDIRDILWRDIENSPVERAIGQGAGLRHDLTPVMASMPVPTMIVSGDADAVVPIEVTLEGYLTLPTDRRHLHVLHGIDHYPNAEAPDQISDALLRFIDAQAP
ncbi:MAG: alpha/beta hydrolase [SAR202 cluster bacterium]|nr:alpha/beta hydrolase [SAR202 cluster bacterium]MDP6664556.1 alpha/beta hydrolase [SAR202 cluster bacterium]